MLLRITADGVRVREAKSVLDPVRVEQVLGQLSPADRDAASRPRPPGRASEKHMKPGPGSELKVGVEVGGVG